MNDTTTLPPTGGKPINQIDPVQVNENLLAANRECVERTAPLVAMLGRCKQQYELYGQSHRAKGTKEGDEKAEVNEGLARDIEQVLVDFRDRSPAATD